MWKRLANVVGAGVDTAEEQRCVGIVLERGDPAGEEAGQEVATGHVALWPRVVYAWNPVPQASHQPERGMARNNHDLAFIGHPVR